MKLSKETQSKLLKVARNLHIYRDRERFSCIEIGVACDALTRNLYSQFYGLGSTDTWFNYISESSSEIQERRIMLVLLFREAKGEL